jgi:hypothetical protein
MSRRDPTTGLTDAELATMAERAYDQRDSVIGWVDEERPEVSPDVRSVVSIRFNRGELAGVERAASMAGMPVSTFIRNAAVNAATAVDLDAARRTIGELRASLDTLTNALNAAGDPAAPRKRRRPAA